MVHIFLQWNGEGYVQAKRFHGKFDMISPVWLTISSKTPLKIPTHDIQKPWLRDMRAADNDNHTVKGELLQSISILNMIYL